MHFTLTGREADPHDIFVIEPDVVLAARADKEFPDGTPSDRSDRQAHMGPDVSAGEPVPPVDATFRAAAVDDILASSRPATAKWAKRSFMALFAVCSAVAAAAWQHYGDAAQQMIASWAPPFVLTSSPPVEKSLPAEQPGSPVVQAAAADQPAAEPAPPAQPAEAAAPTVTASSPESTQMLQSMARDLATMGQQIEQLKGSIEQLKASQEQMARDIARNSETRNSQTKNSETQTSAAKTSAARTSEQNPRPRISAPPLRSAAAPARKPRPALSPAQSAAAPTLPQAAAAPAPPRPEPQAQATARSDDEPVLRPPMPVR
jgi:hypothetical protein